MPPSTKPSNLKPPRRTPNGSKSGRGRDFNGDAALNFLRRALLRLRRGHRQSPGQQRQGEATCDDFPHGPPDITPHRSAITRWTTAVNAQPYAYPLDITGFWRVLLWRPQPHFAQAEKHSTPSERLSVPRPRFRRILGAIRVVGGSSGAARRMGLQLEVKAGPYIRRPPSGGGAHRLARGRLRASVLSRAQPSNARRRVGYRGSDRPEARKPGAQPRNGQDRHRTSGRGSTGPRHE